MTATFPSRFCGHGRLPWRHRAANFRFDIKECGSFAFHAENYFGGDHARPKCGAAAIPHHGFAWTIPSLVDTRRRN